MQLQEQIKYPKIMPLRRANHKKDQLPYYADFSVLKWA
jgi:hypothetical protein